MVIHHRPLGAEGEIGGDKACGTGELSLAPRYFPDDRPPLQVIQTAWPYDPLAYGGEGHFAKAPNGARPYAIAGFPLPEGSCLHDAHLNRPSRLSRTRSKGMVWISLPSIYFEPR
jgi:hypothetical protein